MYCACDCESCCRLCTVPVTVTLFNTSDVVLRVGIDTGVSHNRFYLIVVIVTRLAVVFRHVSFWTLH